MEESGAEYMEVDEESSLLLCEGNEADNLDFEDDFQHSYYARYGRRGSDDRGSKFS